MKKRVKSKKIPIWIKAISAIFIFDAVVLLLLIALRYPNLPLKIVQVLGIALGGTSFSGAGPDFFTIQLILGLSYTEFVALILSMMQSTLIHYAVLFIFVALYLGSGVGLWKGKSWARKIAIVILVSSLALNFIMLLFTAKLIIIGLLLSGGVLCYLLFSKEVKAFFGVRK